MGIQTNNSVRSCSYWGYLLKSINAATPANLVGRRARHKQRLSVTEFGNGFFVLFFCFF